MEGVDDEVTMKVDVGVSVEKSGVTVNVRVDVTVAGTGVFVFVTAGVLVGTFGTQSTWPTLIFVDEPMQFADCSCATVVLYNKDIRYKLSPAFTEYALIHEAGGPQGITVTVGTGGTNRVDPAATVALFKQLPALKLSAVVLYRSAIEYSVSFVPTVIRIHPLGILQTAACGVFTTVVGTAVEVAVGIICVGRGDANSTANVVGMGEGVGGDDGAAVSANASEIPPITRISEIAPMINPLPIWRRAFIATSPPQSCRWRWAATH